MAGGIFSGYPFVPNWKCVVFTALCTSSYWFLPPKNMFIFILLLIIPYISMAWYDYLYNCENKMKATLVPFGRYLFLPLKPSEYKATFESLPPEALKDMDTMDHISAWILLVLVSVFVFNKSV